MVSDKAEIEGIENIRILWMLATSINPRRTLI